MKPILPKIIQMLTFCRNIAAELIKYTIIPSKNNLKPWKYCRNTVCRQLILQNFCGHFCGSQNVETFCGGLGQSS